jgi:hypothetical protein
LYEFQEHLVTQTYTAQLVQISNPLMARVSLAERDSNAMENPMSEPMPQNAAHEQNISTKQGRKIVQKAITKDTPQLVAKKRKITPPSQEP